MSLQIAERKVYLMEEFVLQAKKVSFFDECNYFNSIIQFYNDCFKLNF